MMDERDLQEAAELFKALSAASRLRMLCILSAGPRTVTDLASEAKMSQPLVSQHLRLLRGLDLVSVERSGKEALYALADDHVAHVIRDAITHTRETRRSSPPADRTKEEAS